MLPQSIYGLSEAIRLNFEETDKKTADASKWIANERQRNMKKTEPEIPRIFYGNWSKSFDISIGKHFPIYIFFFLDERIKKTTFFLLIRLSDM